MSIKSHGIVTLTTDFGLKDSYVAAMKGAVLSVNANLKLVDICHQIPAQDIARAGRMLRHACPYYPPGSVHLAVIDPGVGSQRKGVVISAGGHLLVGPDNGVFAPLVELLGFEAAWEIQNAALFREPVSHTFHGRDIFAPVAAHLAVGLEPGTVGPSLDSLVTSNIPQDPSVVDGVLVGQVISVDHFGNLVTNIAVGELALAQVTVITAGRIVPLVETYAEAPPQQLAALFGSDGYLELAIKNGSAADFLDADTGLVVQVDLG